MPRFPAELTERYEIVAKVTESFFCANLIEEGQEMVFDLEGRLQNREGHAPFCIGIISKLHPAILMAQDRLSEGLSPISPRFKHFDCYDTGIDHGGTGKVYVELSLRDRRTGQSVECIEPLS